MYKMVRFQRQTAYTQGLNSTQRSKHCSQSYRYPNQLRYSLKLHPQPGGHCMRSLFEDPEETPGREPESKTTRRFKPFRVAVKSLLEGSAFLT